MVTHTYEFAKLNQLEGEDLNDNEDNNENDFDDELDYPKDQQESLIKKGQKPIPKNDVQLRKANLLLAGGNREIIIYAPVDLTEEEFDFNWRLASITKIWISR